MKFLAFLFISISLLSFASMAEPYRRLVNFEWEPVEGAKGYDIELRPLKSPANESKKSETSKVFSFKTKESVWNGRLVTGKYLMKLRARDYRGVPGDWSPESEFNVGLEKAVLKFPAKAQVVQTNQSDKEKMTFKWAAVGGADEYQFDLKSEDGSVQISEKTKSNEITVELPVAMKYSWEVSSSNHDGIQSETSAISEFTLEGSPLTAPVIEKPESDFVREIKWTRPAHVSSYDVVIYKLNKSEKKWRKFKEFENYQQDSLPFDDQWSGGMYQVQLKANSNLRSSSNISKHRFSVRSGDRSPAAEYTAMVRKSIDRVTGWYGITSYLITEMKFSGQNKERDSKLSYSALGGTARLGAGWMDDRSPWGFVGIVDMTGFMFNGQIKSFASFEANGLYRINYGDRAELRLQAGPYYKEFPETVGTPPQSYQDLKVVSAGPHLGAEYWYSVTPKIGLQLNAHLYASMFKVETPNGGDIVPTMSIQYGFLGSYRFNPRLTGLVGYARREDQVKYKAVPTSSNVAVSGDENSSTITGNYLNLFAEWSF